MDRDAPPVDFTHEYALNLILSQIGHDLTAISQAVLQHEAEHEGKRLQLADRIAERALQPAINANLLRNPDLETPQQVPLALTCFQKVTAIRASGHDRVARFRAVRDARLARHTP